MEKSAKNAVSSADDVTLAFLLTSWANSLSEAHHHAAAATHFETVFHGSRALEIVAGDVLLTDLSEASTVRKALVSLLDRALYGNISFHDHFTSAVVALNQPLNAKDPDLKERCLRERQIALRSVLTFLRDIAINMTAYLDVLPFSSPPADNLKPRSPIAPSTLPSVRPAGPDPTKAVERSMDIWRRSVAGLQAKMALILVLENSLASVDTHFPTAPSDAYFPELNAFCASMRETIRKFISADIATRLDKLSTHYWPGVTRGAHSTVFEAARSRAQLWITQFESSRQQVEAQLDDAGIGFGPSARVSEDKFSVLVSTSAAVAGLVSCHQHAFSWAKHAAKLLNCMVSAFQCLEKAGKGHLGPTEALRTDFYFGLDATFGAIDEVVDWSFSALHDKVLGSLEKSSTDSLHVGNTQPKIRLLRFEEPPRTPSKERELSDNGNAAVGASRRKPRHARMKSSPDALLHLNAHFDDYSDEEVDQGRAVDREIDYNEDHGSEQNSGADNVTKCEANPSQNGGVDGTCGKGSCQKRGDDELPVVYEGQPLEYGGDDEDDDDRDIIVHEDVEDSAKPKKMGHTSHIRSMSVDGIPF